MSAEVVDFRVARERMDRTMKVRFPGSLIARVEQIATAEGLTFSAVVRRALNAGLPDNRTDVQRFNDAMRAINQIGAPVTNVAGPG